MAISREEIEQIAKATAHEVLNTLHRYQLTYHQPENIEQGLTESMGEELTAANWYQKRAEHARARGDMVTAKLYEHVAGEEGDHCREFNQRVIELSE